MARTSGLASRYSMRPNVDMGFSGIPVNGNAGNVSRKRYSAPGKGARNLPSLLSCLCPEVRELPTGETRRPKSGQMGSAKSARSAGKPCEHCKLEFLWLGREPATQL